MAAAHEEDVVMAFRQAVEEEMHKMQEGSGLKREEFFTSGASSEDVLRHLVERHQELEHEVALLRTIVLRLVSDPVDRD